ncbi:MAG: TonB-dependent receptor, partial [Desulfobacterales bacterium]
AEYKDYDYERENEDLDINGIPKPGTKDSADYNVHTKGIYSEIQYRPYDYFKALVGIRHENHSMFGSINLPRYGIIVNPTGNTAVKMSTGKHFKAPTMNELYWPEDDYARGNPDLEPEEGWHANITAEQSLFDEKLFFEVSYFEWDIDNKIGWAENPNYPGPWGNKWTPSNVNSYEANGFEVGTNIKPIDQLMIGLYYTYTDAEEEKSDSAKRQATYTPEHQFKANLTYWFDFGLTVTTISRYVSDRPAHYLSDTDTKPDYTLSSYWTTDIKIEQRLRDHWILSLQANNMFDDEYDTYAENFTDQSTSVTTMEGYPGAGRSVFFSVSYEY